MPYDEAQPLLTPLLESASTWAVESEVLSYDGQTAVVRVTLRLGENTASALGCATADAHSPAIEQAEDRALARLLARLGHPAKPTTQASVEAASSLSLSGVDDRPTPTGPVDLPPEQPSAVTPEFTVVAPPIDDHPWDATPAPGAMSQSSVKPTMTTGTDTGRSRSIRQDEWDSFWRWARSMGITNRSKVEELLGHSIEGLSPREVRALLEPQLAQRPSTAPPSRPSSRPARFP